MFQLLHETVIQAAQTRPGACAFRCGAKQLTYGELDELSSRLASFLIAEGLVPGDRVGVFMPRCVETAVAIYGVLKAGGVFTPIDPHTPARGVEQLITDAGARHVLTQPKKAAVVRQLAAGRGPLECVIGIDEGASQQAGSCRIFPWTAFHDASTSAWGRAAVEPNDLAYIMYSSGSTGKSKGIAHTHFSGLSYARLSVNTYAVRPDDVIANHSPLNFDMSTFGYFANCYAGATTVLVPEAHTKIPASLAKMIEDERITIWYSVPLALVQLLLRAPLDAYDFSALRWVKFGGEPFPPKYLQQLMAKWPQARFSNVYGPAEVNQCTYYHVPAEYAQCPTPPPIPIGRVWDETEGLIVGPDGEVLAAGEAGELVISSPTMMKGYWQLPQRDAVAFLSHPGADGKERTYYRTGDIVQQRADGELMFLGRSDRQVKIRGHRVELDDIEHALCNHTAVEAAGVYCVTTIDSQEVRAAFVAGEEPPPSEEQLKLFLGEVLSPYAIPSTIELVRELPRTVSGKIDRHRLQRQAEHSTAT